MDVIKEKVNEMKNDLVETPVSKHKYKEIARDLKQVEKCGLEKAIKVVFERIVQVPRKVHWRILLDLADFAKRESKLKQAKVLYKLVQNLQPFAY